ncbi:MAG: exodeoxyribonuclease small subunit [Gammaproteobacteria bacterium]|nr:exodeoxyribonuclease small subunit [Gammaproteobacteria bacterium]
MMLSKEALCTGYLQKMSKKQPAPFQFETALQQLTDIVDTLEKGQLGLEESLALFEKGTELTRLCQTALKQAEQKVQILIEKNNSAELEDFDADNDVNA